MRDLIRPHLPLLPLLSEILNKALIVHQKNLLGCLKTRTSASAGKVFVVETTANQIGLHVGMLICVSRWHLVVPAVLMTMI